MNAQATYEALSRNLEQVITGQKNTLRLLLAAFASGNHVLLEDFPGTGKTTLAKALARSMKVDFQRIQFTPDLLPSDILGVTIFDQQKQSFCFHKGPIFTQILLADEINRASPRTQSALLEAMGEGQVSMDGQRYDLGALFFVIATQNPVESHGVYPLPEAQMDRFGVRSSLGYVSPEEEVRILSAQNETHPLETLQPCVSQQEIGALCGAVAQVKISSELKRYIVDIVGATRKVTGIRLGASPRGSLSLMRITQALALFDGLDFVTPEHIREAAEPVLGHRLGMDPQAQFAGTTVAGIIREILKEIKVPV